MHWNVSGIQQWQHAVDFPKTLAGRCTVFSNAVLSCTHSRHLFHWAGFLLFGPFSQFSLTFLSQPFIQLYQRTWALWYSQGRHQISRLWDCTDLQDFQNLIRWMCPSVNEFPKRFICEKSSYQRESSSPTRPKLLSTLTALWKSVQLPWIFGSFCPCWPCCCWLNDH